jgi:ABC-type dipeptide/oligopeptide/nickel transport system permease subunit
MKPVRMLAAGVLLLAALGSIFGPLLLKTSYEQQFRTEPHATASLHHPLGTDDMGRDSLARLVYGLRVSLFLAPVAAALSTILAALIGGLAGSFGSWIERALTAVTDLFLALPWFFLLVTLRAALPLNTSPTTSVIVTFVVLGTLGWAPAARVICSGAKQVMQSDFVWTARATGCSRMRLLRVHVLPNLRPALAAQFFLSIPVFIIAEANLGALGLGVAEPMPSLGGLVRELQDFVMLRPESWRFAPLFVLIAVVGSFQVLLTKEEVRA